MAATQVIKNGLQPGTGRLIPEITVDSGETTGSTDIPHFAGPIFDIWAPVVVITGTQYTLSFEDEDGDELYSSGLMDADTLQHLTPGISYSGTLTVKIVTASSQAAGRTFKPKIIY